MLSLVTSEWYTKTQHTFCMAKQWIHQITHTKTNKSQTTRHNTTVSLTFLLTEDETSVHWK